MIDKIVFVVPPEIAIGYELAGATVYRETDPQQAAKLIAQLATNPNVGLIAIPDHFYQALDTSFLKKLETRAKPVLIQIPLVKRISESIDPLTYIKKTIKRAIGYYFAIDLERGV